MQIEIPNSNNGNEWTRLEFERWLRKNVVSKGNAFLVKFAIHFLLHPDYAYVLPNIVLVHYILDRVIKDNSDIAINGELFGLLGSKIKRTNDEVKCYKIKGIESPQVDITEFMEGFTKKLAHFIIHNWAETPTEVEGIDLDKLHEILGNRGTPNYIPLPLPPPPIHDIKTGGRDPSKKTKTKRVVETELDNLNADIKEVKERQEKHDFILQRLDQRLMRLENK